MRAFCLLEKKGSACLPPFPRCPAILFQSRYNARVHFVDFVTQEADILNLLLLRFRDDCKAKNISFHCDVRENSSAFLDVASITTLYGNLLSNALEAAEASAEKQMELSVIRNIAQSVIVISVINSCDHPPMPDGTGGFHTKKTDPLMHGVGLRAINRVVSKYHGIATMYYDSEHKQFHHVIQFPEPT